LAKHDSILATIGRTPVVRLDRLAPPGANLYAKLEAFNPMGSVKDRLALGVIEDASGGATVAGALEVCRSAAAGSVVLCMLPDTGERYLSTTLFEDIPADMSAEEIAISRSTPGARFDRPPTAVAAAAAGEEPRVSKETEDFVAGVIGDRATPVVLFALEWCEFCWSVRKLLAHCGIPYRSVDLDSVAFQADDQGGRIRAALAARTSSRTIPQVFIGGTCIGGSAEVFDAWREGRLQALLKKSRVPFDETSEVDPRAFLPRWIQPG